jgi:hypothetical protein
MIKQMLLFCLMIGFIHTAQAQADSAGIPVRLSSLQGNVSGTTITLQWTTVCFLSYAYFQVQRSMDGKTFTTIQTFAADRLRCQQPFEWKDTVVSPTNVYYRVNVGDADDRYYQSKIVSLVSRAGCI